MGQALALEAFAELMRRFEPFEPSPQIAIAVSGGADSMALTILGDRWARARGGQAIGLTIDHRMRPEAADEARSVAVWLAARGIAHQTLIWHGDHPAGNRQSAAREARYGLIDGWCRDRGVLHVLVGHHREDQAETLLLRLARGTGMAGLAAMAAVMELSHCRLLRPLLDVPRARLRTTLQVARQDWVEDPSNHDPAFARARLRAQWPALRQLDLDPERLATIASHLGGARAALDFYLARALAETTSLHPAGVITLKAGILRAFPREIRLRALAASLRTVGGQRYAPRFDALDRLDAILIADALDGGRTLGGCRVTPCPDGWLIYREHARIAPPVTIPERGSVIWDRRFVVASSGAAPTSSIGALAIASVNERRAIVEAMTATYLLPRKVWSSLPGVWQEGRLIDVPHLGWRLAGTRINVELRFRPDHPLCPVGFAH